MTLPEMTFREAKLGSLALRDLGLAITGTELERIVPEFQAELECVGIRRLHPHFYLSTEWGVPFNTVAIAIPFYLARTDLLQLHAEQVGHVEGAGRSDILRYLRHEMGHVVNYAYRLYDEAEWVRLFGAFSQPYEEDYRPAPFSGHFVQHLPGWYAQKHPDEDWAETFAVWMTPGRDWRAEHAGRPALAKLDYCDRTMAILKDREPLITAVELDEDVGSLSTTLEQYYRRAPGQDAQQLPGLDGALRALFEDLSEPGPGKVLRRPASALVRGLERDLIASVYQWTGHFPERTRPLLRHLADRADHLNLFYPVERESTAAVGLTTLVTALAMNYVHRGSYLP
jgi:hypothetical protein